MITIIKTNNFIWIPGFMCPNVGWLLLYVWYQKKFKNIKIFWLLAYSQNFNWCQVCLAWVKSYTDLWFLAVMSTNNVDLLIMMKIFKYKTLIRKKLFLGSVSPNVGWCLLYPAHPRWRYSCTSLHGFVQRRQILSFW